MTDEIHYPWMSDPDVPDPEDKAIVHCRVKRMTGVSIDAYTDYGPFRRCARTGCKKCQNIVKRYDGVPKEKRRHPRSASSGRGIPAKTDAELRSEFAVDADVTVQDDIIDQQVLTSDHGAHNAPEGE